MKDALEVIANKYTIYTIRKKILGILSGEHSTVYYYIETAMVIHAYRCQRKGKAETLPNLYGTDPLS